jgi:hypothetical protein
MHTLTSLELLEKHCASDSTTGSDNPASFIVILAKQIINQQKKQLGLHTEA